MFLLFPWQYGFQEHLNSVSVNMKMKRRPCASCSRLKKHWRMMATIPCRVSILLQTTMKKRSQKSNFFIFCCENLEFRFESKYIFLVWKVIKWSWWQKSWCQKRKRKEKAKTNQFNRQQKKKKILSRQWKVGCGIWISDRCMRLIKIFEYTNFYLKISACHQSMKMIHQLYWESENISANHCTQLIQVRKKATFTRAIFGKTMLERFHQKVCTLL